MKKVRNEDGAIIIEATIALTTFMFLIVTVLSIVNICYTQCKIGVSVNQTAKEISQYCYLYSMTGANGLSKDTYNNGNDARESISDTADSITGLYNSITKLDIGKGSDISYDSIKQDMDAINQVVDDGKAAKETIEAQLEKYKDDPKAFILGCANIAGYNLMKGLETNYIIAPLSKVLMRKHLVDKEGGDCEAFLRKLRVVPSGGSYIDGLDFSDSVMFPEDTNDIKVAVTYKIKVIRLLNVDYTFKIEQCGYTKAWVVGNSVFKSRPKPENNDDAEEITTETEEPTTVKIDIDEAVKRVVVSNKDDAVIVLGNYDSDRSNYINCVETYGGMYIDMSKLDNLNLTEEQKMEVRHSFLDTYVINSGTQVILAGNPSMATGEYAEDLAYLESKGFVKYVEAPGSENAWALDKYNR